MASGWVRSLYCKSNDVIPNPNSLLPRSCNACSQPQLKHSIFSFPRPKTKTKTKTKTRQPKPSALPVPPSPPPPLPSASLPALVQLSPNHPTHGIVHRIFLSSWPSPHHRSGASPFPGDIKIVFRIRHPAKALAQFEQYRATVRARSAGSHARCTVDGNEMMCFHCPASLKHYKWPVKGIRVFSGSGGAHESAGIKGMGKRAMLVCRVIAGRVRDGGAGDYWEHESVRAGKDEILVFDRSALLPCFLIVYQL